MSLEKALLAAAQAFVAVMTAGDVKSTPSASPRAAAPAGKSTAAKPAAKPAAKAAAVDDDYAPVKEKILELGAIPGTGRAAVAAILKGFGVAKGPDLDAADYEAAIEQLQASIDELSEQA